MHKRDGESESESESDSVESAGGRASSSSSESGASEEADARASSSESSEGDGEEDGKAMRKRYDEARGAIDRALRGGAPCPNCNGAEVVGCPNCDGQGYYVSYDQQIQCKACRGSGQVVCRACFRGDPWDLEAVRERARRRPD